jgi:hypothetical protein
VFVFGRNMHGQGWRWPQHLVDFLGYRHADERGQVNGFFS